MSKQRVGGPQRHRRWRAGMAAAGEMGVQAVGEFG